MTKKEESKLTGGVKISKTATVRPSLLALSPSNVSKDLNEASEILRNGGVVIFPTDTVYGVGCRYDDKDALSRIYKIKGTPKKQNFPILVSSVDQVKKLAKIGDRAMDLINKYWPGALTIILKSKDSSQKIGFRIPDSQVIKDLISQVGVPIIGTSANFHTQRAVTNFKDLDVKFVELVGHVIEGECELGVESTVVDATINPFKILRRGAVAVK